MRKQGKQVYEFNAFRLDVLDQLLLRNDQPVYLRPKIFDLLVLLVRSDGAVLAKEELMKQLWPDSFVAEGNLTISISLLRKALGSSDDNDIYIETVPRRGYRFIANVRSMCDGTVSLEESAYSGTNFSDTKNSLKDVEQKSIAVLPLGFIGAEQDDEYLGLGLADALITRFGHLREVQVRPTSAVRKYESGEYEPMAIGRELKVDYVLEGNIRRAGERVRVTVQLVSIKDGVTCWAEKFDEWFTDILFVEDSISQQVAQALFITLTGREKKFLTRHQTINAEAYQAYMKGRFFCNKKTRDTLTKSVEYFKQAIKLDGSYAQPFVGLADAYIYMGHFYVLSPKVALAKSKQYVLKALQLDNNLADAHATLALLKILHDWDWAGSEEGFKRAIEINPNYVTAHQWFAVCLRHMGRFGEALWEINKAQELDPVSPVIITTRAFIFYVARNYDEALKELRRALELDINYPIAHHALGVIYAQQKRYKEAIKEFQILSSITEIANPEYTANLAYIYALSGQTSKAYVLLNELTDRAKVEYISPYLIAFIYVGLGDLERAFAFLEKSYQEHDHELCLLKVDPCMAPLLADSRYMSLLERIGLTPQDAQRR